MVPKPLRDAFGLSAGSEVDIDEQDGRIVLSAVGPGTRVVRRRGRPVIEAQGPVAPLTVDDVRALIDAGRR